LRPIDISVVVASFRDRPVLDACLASLVSQCAAGGVELIVARADEPSSLAAIAAAYPTARFVALPPGATLPHIRGAGLAAATGQLAALTEDHCIADAAWVDTMRRYAARDVDVVGGGMDNARQRRALDWGAFFAEYGFFSALKARAGGGVPLLTGANVAYSRRVLPDVVAWMCDGGWENVVHDRLRLGGAAFVFEPAARVGQNLTYALRAFMADRYRHGHDYARARLAESPQSNRWVRAAATLLLPPLLTWRVARTAIGSRSRALAFIRALPFTFVFFGAWAAGEATGYLRGPSSAPRVTAS
jgi:hypothetical protein